MDAIQFRGIQILQRNKDQFELPKYIENVNFVYK